MFEYAESRDQSPAVIRVIGVGGGGGNAVGHMLETKMEGVEFVVANTDAQALGTSASHTRIQLGAGVTKGLGAGADPAVGQKAAIEDRERINEVLQGANMVFITAGMGGGTGTGASPVVAQLAKDLDILTVAVVTKPFGVEGGRRMKIAEAGIAELAEHVDSLITVPNEKLMNVLDADVTLEEAFRAADDVLLGAVRGVSELITRPGTINVDFADVRTVMLQRGRAIMGSGRASGENRAEAAAHAAINCPFLEDIDLSGASGILVNITAGGAGVGLREYQAVGKAVEALTTEDALKVIGTAVDEAVGDELRVTVVATGLGEKQARVQPEVRVKPEIPLLEAAMEAGRGGGGANDYRNYEPPAVYRKPARPRPGGAADAARGGRPQNKTGAGLAAGTSGEEESYLNIPAFVRKQAD